jgi:two-component system CheB/CheR fusion protein
MLRDLVTNALKFTDQGRVLVGCRRRGGALRIEVWDTGIGISNGELQSLFDEYHQAATEVRERDGGLGLGLSIVQRLGGLLDHRVTVRSNAGARSVFIIEVPCVLDPVLPGQRLLWPPLIQAAEMVAPSHGRRTGRILVGQDDLDVRDLLRELLEDEGYEVEVASNGHWAVDKITNVSVRPHLVITDYNLPGGMTGLQVALRLRGGLSDLPVIILTGDISTANRQDMARHSIIQPTKPVKRSELIRTIDDLLPNATQPQTQAIAHPHFAPDKRAGASVIFVVDDDSKVRAALRSVLEDDGRIVEDYSGRGRWRPGSRRRWRRRGRGGYPPSNGSPAPGRGDRGQGSQPVDQAKALVGSRQQQHAAIGTDLTAIERGGDLLLADTWQVERQERIFSIGGHGSFCPGIWCGVENQTLCDSRILYHAR